MNQYVILARMAVENYINEGKIIYPPKDLPKEFFERKSGAFITIMKEGELRGCIGTYLPTRNNIAEEIIHNAIAAATEDYRFGSIQKEELSDLSYSICILNAPELVRDIKELNPQKYGIIVKTAGITSSKSGLLLPDLPGIDTVEKQILITCQKGGIDPVNEQIIIYRFVVEKHE